MSAETLQTLRAALEAHVVDEATRTGKLESDGTHVMLSWIAYACVSTVGRPGAYYHKAHDEGPPHVEVGLATMLAEHLDPFGEDD